MNHKYVGIFFSCIALLGLCLLAYDSIAHVAAKETDAPQYLQKLPNGSYLMRYADPYYNANCYVVVGTIDRMGTGGSSAPVSSISCVQRTK